MKFFDLKQDNGGAENPCQLISAYLLHEQEGGTLKSFLETFDFESREEVERAIRTFIRVVSLDPYMRRKHLAEANAFAAAVFTRYNKIFTDESRLSKMPVVMSSELWHGGYSRRLLDERTRAMFGGVNPDAEVFAKTCQRIKEVYSLTDIDIEKLHFFVEQVKAGERFPNSLRRMLYIWGATKQTGKTTTATMLVSLLNGDMNEEHISRYSTNLSNEMQIKGFAVPKISECNVCLMDECFYADMGKTYADFKRFITSSNGRARVPFGQEFEWMGQPNYVATSNESLQKFIKDWNDRRYLSIEFKSKPKKKMSFDAIKKMWLDFVLNSERTRDWQDWNDELAPETEEKGDRQAVADDLEIELRKLSMINRVLDLSTPSASPSCPENHVPLKMFVDWFAQSMGTTEAHKRRGEIEAAVTAVYGQRYSVTRYWLLSRLRERAQELKDEISNASYADGEATDVKLPF